MDFIDCETNARVLEGVTIPFSGEYSQPRDQTPVSCIAGRFFTIWTTGEAPNTSSGPAYAPALREAGIWGLSPQYWHLDKHLLEQQNAEKL